MVRRRHGAVERKCGDGPCGACAGRRGELLDGRGRVGHHVGAALALAVALGPRRRRAVSLRLVVLGVWVAARPYLRNGLAPWIVAALPQNQATYVVDDS